MQPSVRRSVAFAAVASLSLAAPVAGALTAVPYALIAVAGRTVSDGIVFDVFARPGDRIAGELRGLVGFSLAVTALMLLVALAGLPVGVFVATVMLVGYGNLAEELLSSQTQAPIVKTAGFAAGGALAAVGGQLVAVSFSNLAIEPAMTIFLAAVAALAAALLRAVFAERDDPVVLVSVAFFLWIFAALGVRLDPFELGLAIVVAGVFGYLSWLLGAASITGMLTGVLISLLTIVLGGYGWFAVLISFFGFGGMATKYRLDEKRTFGVAEGNRGARGSRNVLGNSAVALVAVVGFAASNQLGISPSVFLFGFAGSVATAMSDTLSSEIGVLFGEPRLITTMEPVTTGTDGGVTLEGGLAGVGGAAAVAVIALGFLDLQMTSAVVIGIAGVVGMLLDSLLGATIEGRWIGNQAVNLLATAGGALACAGLAGWLGVASV